MRAEFHADLEEVSRLLVAMADEVRERHEARPPRPCSTRTRASPRA